MAFQGTEAWRLIANVDEKLTAVDQPGDYRDVHQKRSSLPLFPRNGASSRTANRTQRLFTMLHLLLTSRRRDTKVLSRCMHNLSRAQPCIFGTITTLVPQGFMQRHANGSLCFGSLEIWTKRCTLPISTPQPSGLEVPAHRRDRLVRTPSFEHLRPVTAPTTNRDRQKAEVSFIAEACIKYTTQSSTHAANGWIRPAMIRTHIDVHSARRIVSY